jgi:hypothetical protein
MESSSLSFREHNHVVDTTSSSCLVVPLLMEENNIDIVRKESTCHDEAIVPKSHHVTNHHNGKQRVDIRPLTTASTNTTTTTMTTNENDILPTRNNNNIPSTWISSMKALLHLFFIFLPLMIWNGLRLLLFVLTLFIPGFARIASYYFLSSKRISRRYQTISCRQTIDIYGAVMSTSSSSSTAHDDVTNNDDHMDDSCEDISIVRNHQDTPTSRTCHTKKPVLIFAPGGAWIIGYKMWGVFTARALEPFGLLIMVCDYRNYPWGTVPDMVDDMTDAINWSISNCGTCLFFPFVDLFNINCQFVGIYMYKDGREICHFILCFVLNGESFLSD